MKLFFFLLLFGSVPVSIAQTGPQNFPDKDASFPGGLQEMMKFVQSEVVYPEISKINGDQGSVYVDFIVDREGYLTDIQVRQGVSPELDEEAIRIVSSMPRWTPASFKGEPMPIQCRLPIKFSLDKRTIREARKKYRKSRK